MLTTRDKLEGKEHCPKTTEKNLRLWSLAPAGRIPLLHRPQLRELSPGLCLCSPLPLGTYGPDAQRPLPCFWNTHPCLILTPGMVFRDVPSWWAGVLHWSFETNDGLVKGLNTKRAGRAETVETEGMPLGKLRMSSRCWQAPGSIEREGVDVSSGK